MADTVTSQVIFSGDRRYVAQFTNVSDGTGESNVQKVDISSLTLPDGTAPNRVVIEEMEWGVQGFDYVKLSFDHTTDDTGVLLAGNGYKDYRPYGGLQDPASAGGTGDILFSTSGATSGASYDVLLHLRLK